MNSTTDKSKLIEFVKAQVVLRQLKLMGQNHGPFLEDNQYCDSALAQQVLQRSIGDGIRVEYTRIAEELFLGGKLGPELNHKFLKDPSSPESPELLQEVLYLIAVDTAKIIFNDQDNDVVDKALSVLSLGLLRTLRPQQIRLNTTLLEALDQDTAYVERLKEWHTLFERLFMSHITVAEFRLQDQKRVKTLISQLRELGNNLMANLSYPQAIMVYTQAIDASNTSCEKLEPQIYTNRAIAFIGLNCFAEAITDLNTAVEKDPTFTPAWAQLGYCQLYLGKSLEALDCYLQSLRALAGEVYPNDFPDDEKAREYYTEARLQSVFPQFVQRLTQSIILTEKRAYQQRIASDQIRDRTTRVRAILARFRANSSPEDMHYFSYSYENDVENMRSTAARANRHRPSILTPEVAHDIMASGSMEASAVAIPFPGFNRQRNRGNNDGDGENNNGGAEQTNTNGNANNNPENDNNTREERPGGGNPDDFPLRGLFNNLGDIFGDVIQSQTLNFFPNDPPRPQDGAVRPNVEIQVEALGGIPENIRAQQGQEPTADPTQSDEPNQGNATNTQRELNSQLQDEPARGPEGRSAIRDFTLSLNHMWGNYGRVFDNYLRNQDRSNSQESSSRPPASTRQNSQPNVSTTENSSRGREGGSTPARNSPSEDADMPDAPDVD